MSVLERVASQQETMQRYYRWHARVYDATRWFFLFGRRRLLRRLPQKPVLCLLEVGCGTGFNLKRIARQHPQWKLIGIDVSRHMLDRAFYAVRRYIQRIFLVQKDYLSELLRQKEPLDVVLFSYSLSMFDDRQKEALARAYSDLKIGGYIAVVDFHDTRIGWFRRWMRLNHVRMEGDLLPQLQTLFSAQHCEVRQAYGGLWRYFLFIGQKSAS